MLYTPAAPKERIRMNGAATERLLRSAAMLGLLALGALVQAQQLTWARAMGAEGDDVAQAITVDAMGNVLVAGYFESTVDLDPGPAELVRTSNGGSDVYVQKFTADGALIWALSVGGAEADYATGISTDAQGNVYVCGVFSDVADFDPGAATSTLTSAGGLDIFLAKFTADGTLVRAQAIGGADYDEPKAVAVGALGNVYLLSYFSTTIDADPGLDVLSITSQGDLDMLLQKFNGNGELIWAQATGSAGNDFGLSLAVDSDENIWITGSFEGTLDMDPGAATFPLTSAGAWDIFVTKRAADGAFLWAGRMGGPENFDNGYDIAVDAQGNAIIAGSFFGTGDFDPGTEEHLLTASSLGSDEVFVVKLDPSGGFLWAAAMGGNDADLAYGVAVANDGRVHVTGLFSATADFDPDPVTTFGMTTVSPDNFFDSFLCTLSADGDFIGAWQFGGANSIATQSIARGADDALFVAGHFESAPDFDPGASEVILTNAGFRDAFTLRFDPIGVGMPERFSDAPVLFPNPASDHVLIEVDAHMIGASYTVSDDRGRVVLLGRLHDARTRVPVLALPVGHYHVRMLRSGMRNVATFVVVR